MKQEISMDKKYITRDGRDVELLAIRDKLSRPVVGIVGGNSLYCWHKNGCIVSKNDEADVNLIEVNPYADFKIDDKVLVKDKGDLSWNKAHFSHIGDDNEYPFHIFMEGLTSFTSEDNATIYYQECVKWEDRTEDMRVWK